VEEDCGNRAQFDGRACRSQFHSDDILSSKGMPGAPCADAA
jgi:hypothetical protein